VDLYVAKRARLLLGRLLSGHDRETSRCAGSDWRVSEGRRSVALQALQVDVAVLQHVRVRASVRDMAGCASFNFHGSVLEHEWALLILVALETDEVPGRRGSDIPDQMI
jgi:hypothetical protein